MTLHILQMTLYITPMFTIPKKSQSNRSRWTKRCPEPVTNVEFVDVDKGRGGVGPLSKIKFGLIDDGDARSVACKTVAEFVCVELPLWKV